MGVYSTDGSDFRPVTPTGDRFVDGVLNTFAWDHTTLTVSFPTHLPQYQGVRPQSGAFVPNFAPLTAAEQATVHTILDEVAQFTNLQFQFMTETPNDHALIRYANGVNDDVAEAGIPNYDNLAANVPASGDVWLGGQPGDFDAPVQGDFYYLTFIHETGHALGLTHAHDTDAFGTVPSPRDFQAYTVMSYKSFAGGLSHGGYSIGASDFPQSYMLLDIAALQYVYGANYTSHAGDTVYSWDPATGEEFIDGVAQDAPTGNRIFQTLWDGGGNDTYDLSAYTNHVTVDLRPGHWSTLSSAQLARLGEPTPGDVVHAPGNIANAYLHDGDPRSLIENAVGGTGSDTIIGNIAANHLSGGIGADDLQGRGGRDVLDGGDGPDTLDGGKGDDVLIGGPGDDTLLGGAGRDTADYSGAGSALTIDLRIAGSQDTGAGIDTLDSIERLIGSRFNDTLTGDGGANRIDGGGGGDTICGGRGNDVLIGGGGNDVIVGGGGKDVLTGGLGSDTFRYLDLRDSKVAGPSRDIIKDFQDGPDKIDLSAIDAVTGGSDDAFHFVGAAAFANAGDLRAVVSGHTTFVSGDVNGDHVADFMIALTGQHNLTAGNFIL